MCLNFKAIIPVSRVTSPTNDFVLDIHGSLFYEKKIFPASLFPQNGNAFVFVASGNNSSVMTFNSNTIKALGIPFRSFYNSIWFRSKNRKQEPFSEWMNPEISNVIVTFLRLCIKALVIDTWKILFTNIFCNPRTHPTHLNELFISFQLFRLCQKQSKLNFFPNANEQASVDEIIKLAIENGEPSIGVSVAEVILVIDNKEGKSIPPTFEERQATSRLPGKSLPRTLYPLKKFQFSALIFSINYSNVVQFKILMSFSFFSRPLGATKTFFRGFRFDGWTKENMNSTKLTSGR